MLTQPDLVWRAGRKEAEGVTSGLAVRRSVLQGARQSSEDLEPVSVSNRRVTAASRGAKAAGTTGLHAPKFATEGTPVSRYTLSLIVLISLLG